MIQSNPLVLTPHKAVTGQHVSVKAGFGGKSFSTRLAHVLPDTEVQVLVVGQTVFPVEAHLTIAALVGLVCGVGLHVSHEVGLQGEALATDGTHEQMSVTAGTAVVSRPTAAVVRIKLVHLVVRVFT